MPKKTATVKPQPRPDDAIQEDLPPRPELVHVFREKERELGGKDAARVLLTRMVLHQFHDRFVREAEGKDEIHSRENVRTEMVWEGLSLIVQFGHPPYEDRMRSYVEHLESVVSEKNSDFFSNAKLSSVHRASIKGLNRLVLFSVYGEEAEYLFRLRLDKGQRGLAPFQLGVVFGGDEKAVTEAMDKEQDLADLRYLVTLCALTPGPPMRTPIGSASLFGAISILYALGCSFLKAKASIAEFYGLLGFDDPEDLLPNRIRAQFERWTGTRE